MRTLRPEEVDAILAREPRGCVMCALARGSVTGAPEIFRAKDAICVLDRFGVRRGHLLVVLDRHEEKLAALAWEEWEALHRVAWEATRALEAALRPTRVYVAALGASVALERTFPHVHLHVIPIYDGGRDDRPSEVLTWKNGVIAYEDDESRALAAELRAAWPRETR